MERTRLELFFCLRSSHLAANAPTGSSFKGQTVGPFYRPCQKVQITFQDEFKIKNRQDTYMYLGGFLFLRNIGTLSQCNSFETGDFEIRINGPHVLGDAFFAVLNKILIDQGVVLEKPFQFPLGDFIKHFLRLAFLT